MDETIKSDNPTGSGPTVKVGGMMFDLSGGESGSDDVAVVEAYDPYDELGVETERTPESSAAPAATAEPDAASRITDWGRIPPTFSPSDQPARASEIAEHFILDDGGGSESQAAYEEWTKACCPNLTEDEAVEIFRAACDCFHESRKALTVEDMLASTATGSDRAEHAHRVAAHYIRKPHHSSEDARVLYEHWAAANCSPPLPEGERDAVWNEEWCTHLSSRPAFDPSPYEKDQANAARFHHRFGKDYLCQPFSKAWHRWDGRRWKGVPDQTVEKDMLSVVSDRVEEAKRIVDSDKKQKELRDIASSMYQSRMRAAVDAARKFCLLEGALDSNAMLLNCANGTLDLATGKLRENRREDLITKLTPVGYDPAARCPNWLAFLNLIFNGDSDVIEYVQKSVGYTLTGDASEKLFYVLWGPTDTGKTTFIETVRELAGEYAKTAARQSILLRKGSSDKVPDDIHRLRGARLIVVSETEEGDRLASGLIKVFSGNAHQATRPLYGQWQDWLPQGTFWIDTNHKPSIGGGDDAMWGRVRLIPFEVDLKRKVGSLDRHFRQNKLVPELPGILAWAVRGGQLWRQRGLAHPLAVALATATYQQEEDALGAFITEACEVSPNKRVWKATFREALTEWYRENVNEHTKYMQGAKRTRRRMLEMGFGEDRSKSQRYWTGIDVKKDYRPDAWRDRFSGV